MILKDIILNFLVQYSTIIIIVTQIIVFYVTIRIKIKNKKIEKKLRDEQFK